MTYMYDKLHDMLIFPIQYNERRRFSRTYCAMTYSFTLENDEDKLSSIYVFSYFPFGFEGRIWDLIVSVPDHCLSFYFTLLLV